MSHSHIKAGLQQILDETRLSDEEVARRLELAADPAYWQTLNPACSVGGTGVPTLDGAPALDDIELTRLTESLSRDGYFQTARLLPESTVRCLRQAVEAVHAADWPASFALVYDEFWGVLTLPSLVRLLSAQLGTSYRLVPHVWVFHLPPRSRGRGWPPHAEAVDRLQRLTVWIPLAPSTLDNGCMYVIPKTAVQEDVLRRFGRVAEMSFQDAQMLLQASRALPAEAGAVLGWDHQLIHWGSICRGSTEPRMSLSVEFIHAYQLPRSDETPLFMGDGVLPTFSERLMLIARALESYRRFEPQMIRFEALARELTDRFDA